MITTSPNNEITKDFLDLFNQNAEKILGSGTSYINEIRKQALRNFEGKGIPSNRIEDYKYTNLEPHFKNTYNKYFEPREMDFDINDIFKCDVPNLDTNTVILLNGFYYDKKNPLQKLEKGALIGSFSEAGKKYPELFEKHFSKYASNENEGLVALNTAFAQDGLFMYVPDNVVLEIPIQIINMMMSDENIMAQYRNLIILGKNAKVTLIVCDHTLSPHKFLTNSVSEIFTGDNSRLNYYKIQNENNESTQISNTYIHQERDSRVSSSVITLHGGLVRNNMYVNLNGEGCDCNITGLFFADKAQHVDNYTFIDHKAPHCTSNQLFKGVLDQLATGAFNGKIMVRPDAQKTIAYQKNNNILLSNDVKMNSKPQLEIYADDVKCSHGATSGQLDEDALFYMRSRGVNEKEAKLLLMHAFTKEVISHLDVKPLQERIDSMVNQRLRGELSRCNNCPVHCC
ncbi:MAG: Fe-S cluster assembly protein SufD [Bacteroidales bacterium]|nr:Fe-S cluster assembly protein SufD [Bacteroidales bacterium]